jgi:hypothetical protein
MKKPSFKERMKFPLTPLGTTVTTKWEGNKPRRRKKKKPLDKGYD